MNRIKLVIGLGALLCALLALASTAVAAEFKAKTECPNKTKGCFTGAKSTANQIFSFETEKEKKPFKVVCTKIEQAKNAFYAVNQPKIKEVQLSGPQNLVGEEIALNQEEKSEWAMIKPIYSGCQYKEDPKKEAVLDLNFVKELKNRTCVWGFKANGEFSMLPKECELEITVPALANCKIRLEAAENVNLKAVTYKVNGTNVVFELNIKTLRGEQNGECEVGATSKIEGSYTGKIEVESAEFK